MITDCSGNVRDAVEKFKKGQLSAKTPEGSQPGLQRGLGASPLGNTSRRAAYGGISGMGMGRGGGRGRSMGGCRGGGMGGGRGRGMAGMTGVFMDEQTAFYMPDNSIPEDGLEGLKGQAAFLKEQLADIERRIAAMENKNR